MNEALHGRQAAVKIERDVVFGRAGVGHSTPATRRSRDLLMDVYRPRDASGTGALPAMVLAFGGAFHRGSRADDRVVDGSTGNTAIAAYCERFARRGYVCFSIDYRLVPEDPDPGDTPVVDDPDSVPRSRVDVVRRIMELPVATNAMLWRGIEAASDDFAAALRFVAAHAGRWGVDAGRIAAGGFSAGARSAWNAVYAEGAPAAAVVSLSGTMDPRDLARCLRSGRALPPLLLVRGADDLDYVCEQNPRAAAMCRAEGIRCVEAVVPDSGHFYPAEAPCVAADDDAAVCVEDRVAVFVDACLAATAQPLERQADAAPASALSR